MSTIITDIQTKGARMRWEHGDYSGTISLPGNEREPVNIQWDAGCPDNYEELEEAIESAAYRALETPNTERAILWDNFREPRAPVRIFGVQVVPDYVSRKEELEKNAYKARLTRLQAAESVAPDLLRTAAFTVEYRCENCGEFHVIKSKASLDQICTSCGEPATPVRVTDVAIRDGGKWHHVILDTNPRDTP